MNDEIWQRDEVESPCVKICVIDERHGHCLGCFRTRQEIATWSRARSEERREILSKLPARRAEFQPKRSGGRRNRRSES